MLKLLQQRAFQILCALWCVFLIVLVSGIRTEVLGKALVVCTALVVGAVALWGGRRLVQHLGDSTLALLERYVNWPVLVGTVAVTFAVALSCFILDFEGLNGTLWDLTFFIQGVYKQWSVGVPQWTFGDVVLNYNFSHRSLSVVVMGWLYGWARHPWVVLLWQWFWLMMPGLISVLFYIAACARARLKPTFVGVLLAYLLWAMSPVVWQQKVYPYTYHIMGLSVFALAFLFYYQQKILMSAILLIILAFEKEDFGMFTASFGMLMALEGLGFVRRGKQKVRGYVLLAVACILAFAGPYSFFSFSATHAQIVPFANRFGNFGNTPREAIFNFFRHPTWMAQAVLRPHAFQYILFFIATSFVWWLRRWEVVKWTIPFAGVVFLFSISSYEPMFLLKDPYALMPFVGVVATLILGGFSYLAVTKKDQGRQAHLFLLVAFLSFFAWGSQSHFRTLREKISLYQDHKQERLMLEPLRQNRDLIVCCEERLCALVADRPLVLEARHCRRGAKLLRGHDGETAVYVVYTGGAEEFKALGLPSMPLPGPHVPYPKVWQYETKFLKISHPVKVQALEVADF